MPSFLCAAPISSWYTVFLDVGVPDSDNAVNDFVLSIIHSNRTIAGSTNVSQKNKLYLIVMQS